jgi:hypothetical protein
MDISKLKSISLTIDRMCDIKFSNELNSIEHIKSVILKDKTAYQYYSGMFKKFESELEELKRENYQIQIFEKLLNQLQPLLPIVHNRYMEHNSHRSKKSINQDSEYVKSGRHDFFHDLHRHQYSFVSKVEGKLKDEIKFFIPTSKEIVPIIQTTNNQVTSQKANTPIQQNTTPRRIVFSTSKTETLIFIYVLEQSGIIKFEDEKHLKSFIEEQLSYTENRNNPDKGKHLPMNDVSTDISKLKDFTNGKARNRVLNKLNTKLSEILDSYIFAEKRS